MRYVDFEMTECGCLTEWFKFGDKLIGRFFDEQGNLLSIIDHTNMLITTCEARMSFFNTLMNRAKNKL